MVAWILIFTGIVIWFYIGLRFVTQESAKIKAEEAKAWEHPINNDEYGRFLKSAGWKSISKIIVEHNYDE